MLQGREGDQHRGFAVAQARDSGGVVARLGRCTEKFGWKLLWRANWGLVLEVR